MASLHNGMSLPIGTILPYVGKKEIAANLHSQGWLLCDGRPCSIKDQAALYRTIGNAFGGDDNKTFYLPDLRGMFLRGVDDGAGVDPDAASRTEQRANGNVGDSVGTRQAHQLESHAHGYSHLGTDSYELPRQGGGFNPYHIYSSQSTEFYGGTETRPVNASVYYLIFAGR
ncbi:hypothetical protein EHS25_001944 [Saitozyma podzolica]|uniref:Phage tail collar domain-containing protein n=1 Tax=Saitozyma podzolica TaxID=1890683 RepID=A0A427YFT9_9TREE|nr:hypothetical protein EHS25_001944 [Saitozyma podzolica]